MPKNDCAPLLKGAPPYYLRLKITPKSPRSTWGETLADETIKVRIAAPAEKGKANAELIKFLSKEFGVGRANITIVAGKTDHLKLIKIT